MDSYRVDSFLNLHNLGRKEGLRFPWACITPVDNPQLEVVEAGSA